ncbi:MAG: hypothetical protein ACYCUM_03410 [Solirubrobacteraceae bacterium]
MTPPAAAELVCVGWRASEVERELPELRVLSCEVLTARSCLRPSPEPIRRQLAALSDRFNGAKAIALRGQAVPAAYRALSNAIGIDPDVVATPIEQAVFGRMFNGAFLSVNLIEDALLIALVDTAVAVAALDADLLTGQLGIRPAVAGERLRSAEPEPPLAGGELVLADGVDPLALLGVPVPRCAAPRRATRRLRLYALEFAGVSQLTVREALWIAASTLEAHR